jgi:propionyl-CoA carboxylase alpha chain
VIDEKTTGELKVQMYGADTLALIQSWREYELSKHMHLPIIPDTSSMVLSPMPGALISFAVKPGDSVQIGQELCIVEAMKMQNIIRAPKAGQIANLLVKVGASLAADQVILDFVPEGEEYHDK